MTADHARKLPESSLQRFLHLKEASQLYLPEDACKAKWNGVVAFHGYPLDRPEVPTARFPSSMKERVQDEIPAILQQWKIGQGDLALCTGSTETDIFFGQPVSNAVLRFVF